MKKLLWVLISITIIWALSGCASAAAPTVVDTARPTVTEPPPPTDTALPPTATPIPPTPTEVPPTSTPTATPDPVYSGVLCQDDAQIGVTVVSPIDGMTLACIPAGAFKMGNSEKEIEWIRGHDRSELDMLSYQPQHEITLDAFWMDTTEVTNAMYAQCVAAGACQPPAPRVNRYSQREADYGLPEFDNHPVLFVNWENAATYCAWAGRRLPTEAEWERAARGGLEEMLFPWGDEQPVCTPGALNGAQGDIRCDPNDTIPVASFAPNGFGLYDMAGNVWEWVADWYMSDYYLTSPAVNPPGPETAYGMRAVRGSNWWSDRQTWHLGLRIGINANIFGESLGFRCAHSK